MAPGLHAQVLAVAPSSSGPNPPRLVLVHGFTQTGRSWAPLAPALAAGGLEVVAVDAPGHGGSSGVRADLWGGAEMLGAAGGRAIYAGYSMGARLCLHLALARPELAAGLVLVGATAGIEDPDERAARRSADEALADTLDGPGAGGEPLRSFLDEWLSKPLFATLDSAAAGLEDRLRNSAAGLASSLRLAGTGTQEPLWDRLATLSMPTLVLAGALDAKFAALGQRIAGAIGPNARLGLVAGAGHAAHLERPGEVVEAVLAFVGGALEPERGICAS